MFDSIAYNVVNEIEMKCNGLKVWVYHSDYTILTSNFSRNLKSAPDPSLLGFRCSHWKKFWSMSSTTPNYPQRHHHF